MHSFQKTLLLLIVCLACFCLGGVSSIEVRDPTPQSLRGAAAEESNVEESNVEGSNSEEQAKEEAKSLLRDFEPPRYVSRKAINYREALQRLQLATGTDVTIFADFRLTKAKCSRLQNTL